MQMPMPDPIPALPAAQAAREAPCPTDLIPKNLAALKTAVPLLK